MPEKWPVKTTQYAKGKRGPATVRVLEKQGIVRAAFADDPQKIYEFTLDNCPDNIRSGKWVITLSGDETRLYQFMPVAGVFQVKFKKFACPEGQIPSPKHYTSEFTDKKTGKIIPTEYDAFTALLEIVDGKDAGLVIPFFIRYNFGEVDGVVSFIKPKSNYTTQLMAFMEASGAFDKGVMKWSENILPALEARIHECDKVMMVILRDGSIDSISALEIADDSNDDVDDLLGTDELDSDSSPAE